MLQQPVTVLNFPSQDSEQSDWVALRLTQISRKKLKLLAAVLESAGAEDCSAVICKLLMIMKLCARLWVTGLVLLKEVVFPRLFTFISCSVSACMD